jgi:pimeloyl-ACP methyl ester carboxylesterase
MPISRPPALDVLRSRSLNFQCYRWHGSLDPPLVLLHGWGDSGATFQFLVEYLDEGRDVFAFDGRGFGKTEWPADGYWFPDYLADLDALLERLFPATAIDLLGHSLGGNVAMLYAAARPERVRRLISLEGFGLPPTDPAGAPHRYLQWLDEIRAGKRFATYSGFDEFVRTLAKRNPRTSAERLEFIARAWAREDVEGRIHLLADPRHKLTSPMLYQHENTVACWRKIVAPTLLVLGDRSEYAAYVAPELLGETPVVRGLQRAIVSGAGHMLHHEMPELVAELLEAFLR